MGVSTDAILFYGYVWDDEVDLFDDEDGELEWPDVVAKRRGIVSPYDSFVGSTASGWEARRAEEEKWFADHQTELDEWRAVLDGIENEFGVRIGHHGSDGWSVPYLCIGTTRKSASRGYPQSLGGPEDFAINPDWNGMLREFCEELGIEPPEDQAPGWYMVSWWG